MFDLTGKKALVTGASGGIGEAIARTFHARGAIVGLHGTREEKLNALAGELGERTLVLPANLSDLDAVDALGEKAEAEMEGVDILVNNAGMTRDGLLARMPNDDWGGTNTGAAYVWYLSDAGNARSWHPVARLTAIIQNRRTTSEIAARCAGIRRLFR